MEYTGIKWSLYDEDELNVLEERLFSTSFHAESADLNKVVEYRTRKNFKSRSFEHVVRCVRTYKSSEDNDFKTKLSSQYGLKEYLRHKDCFEFNSTVRQIPRTFDISTNLCFEFFKRHPSPIFSSLAKMPKCCQHKHAISNYTHVEFYTLLKGELKELQERISDRRFSLLDFNFKYLLKYKRLLLLFNQITDAKFLNIVVLIGLQLYDMMLSFHHIVTILDRMNQAYTGVPVRMCPGLILYAAPGTGKSHFIYSSGHFMIDTDWFPQQVKSSNFIVNLVNSGFCVVTNVLHTTDYTENCVTVCISLSDKKQHEIYEAKGFYIKWEEFNAEKQARLRALYYDAYKKQPQKHFSEWEKERIEAILLLPVIKLKDQQSFADGLRQIYFVLVSLR